MKLHPLIFCVLLLQVSLTGCVHQQITPESSDDLVNADPWEGFNRSIYKFNGAIDLAVIKPAAKAYRKVLPSRVRRGIGNVFQNLREPTTIVNDLLQAKFHNAISDTTRLLVNSIFGLGGWFDLADKMGLEPHNEDFGQTFAQWGFGPGPYLMLPLLGPSTLLDAVGLIPHYTLTDPRIQLENGTEQFQLLLLDSLNQRSQLLGASKLLDLQLDPYEFIREAYLQKRLDLIYDGDPPLELLDEDF